MLFNSNHFILVFLPVVFLFFHFIRHFSISAAFNFMALASLLFYGYGEPKFLLLLLASVTFNYFVGCHLIEQKNKQLLIIAIAANVAAIGYFKYSNFFVENLNAVFSVKMALSDVALPLGISFYTFQKIAFLVDAYKSKIKKPSIVEYLLFVSFFPQLIAGPIVHYNQIETQLRSREAIPLRLITAGIFLYSIGLFKKSMFADFAGSWADFVFNNPVAASPEQSALAVIAYTLQIYFDFSGYSDMALGLGMMFGIVLPINFNSPYKSKSIVEFWRRWHITLSTWLRDYVYIPLGGRANSQFGRSFNLMVTMLIGGLWHGAAWTFVVWGALHGIGLVINHLWLRIRPSFLVGDNTLISIPYSFISWLSTFAFVSVLWIIFRANSFADAITVMQKMLSINTYDLSFSLPRMTEYFSQDVHSFSVWLFTQAYCTAFNAAILAALLLITWLAPNSMWWSSRFRPNLITALFCAATVCAVVAANIFLVTPNAFIYFRF
jgi:alginate O-acetyltransferase complex protein AlgI